MGKIFMNSGNSKTPDLHRLLLNLSVKNKVKKRNDKYVYLSTNLSTYCTWKNMKNQTKIINWKFGSDMELRISITWRIICRIRYSSLFWIYLKKHGENTDEPSIIIYINKIENRITFKIKTGYYFEPLTHEKMELLGSTKNKITKEEICEKSASFRNYLSSISTLQYC